MPLTRAEILDQARLRLGLSRRVADEILDELLAAIGRELAAGREVTISGLGRFGVKWKKSRPGRNPRTGALAVVPARRRVVFQLSRTLRAGLKAGSGDRHTEEL